MPREFCRSLLPLVAVLALGSCASSTSSDSATSAAPPPAATAAVATAPPVAPIVLPGCVSQHEREAFEVYALRTEAIVGAQSCRLTPRFNSFATKFRTELTAEGRALRTYYHKAHGKSGDAALDEFVTQLANMSFINGSANADYCAATTALFDDVMATRVGQLAAYSAQHSAPALPRMDSCDSVAVIPR
jgi:hypothetical protein